jgi:DNA polymerase III subunit delta'
MTLAAVVGQQRAIDALRSALKLKAVHQAYLFAGPEGVGKELTAIGFAQALACRERPGEGCGECSTCARISRRSHPDVTWVMPQEEMIARGLAARAEFSNTPSREIRVEQIRALQERLALRPLEGAAKMAIIASADRMNTQSQNALLKTLEEPPSGSVLVLLASSPELLLATIRSRCAKIQFGPVPADFIADKVQSERHLDRATAQLAAVMSEGSLSRALELDLEALTRRREVIALFEAAVGHQLIPMLQFAETFGASREIAEEVLAILRVWLRDLLTARSGATRLNYSDLRELTEERAFKQSEATIHARWALLERAAAAIAERNAAPRLQLERMLIEMERT